MKRVVGGMGMTAVDVDKTAIAADDLGPTGKAVEFLRAIILAAAIGDVRIRWMQRDTCELCDLQITVDIRPFELARIGIIEAVDAAVIGIQQLAVAVEIKGVNIRISAVGNYRPRVAAYPAFRP